MSFQAPKGTYDVLAPDSQAWRNALSAWEDWSGRYGYPLVMTPLFEATELFERGVGDTTDVVSKQMYTFEDKGGRSVTLRPEGTAGVVRAFLDSGAQGAWKGAYSGPMFRYERPQKGRSRQFWQVGVEYLDVSTPLADVEVIDLGYRYIEFLGVEGLELKINSLGDEVCRPGYLEKLTSYFQANADRLCEDSRDLIERNPLRILDCKVCTGVSEHAPSMADHLCADCQTHHQTVMENLNEIEIPFVEDPSLVRGLDYYTRTAFEYIGTSLEAAQNAVGGGGRYDGLAEAIGGRSAPGVGFALGMDRLILAMEGRGISDLDVYLVSEIGPEGVVAMVSQLRQDGHRVDFDPEGKSVKSQFKAAGRSGAPLTIIVHGRDEPVTVRTEDDRIEMPFQEVSQWLNNSPV